MFILASASPRRREILQTLGLSFEVAPVDVDESALAGEAPAAYLERVVASKLAAAQARHPGRPVLVADTTVVVDDRMLAKPADEADNRAMIAALAGRSHQVMTRFAAHGPRATVAATIATRVRFRALSSAEIAAYAASGEGRDKAGGYAIQGLGSFMIEAIDGSYASVVGLPACEVAQALVEAGVIPSFPLPR